MVSYIPNHNKFKKEISLDEITAGRTLNSKLTGTANQRTLIKPNIVAPAYDIDSWKTNPAVFHSQINKKTIKNLSMSGMRTTSSDSQSSIPSIENWSREHTPAPASTPAPTQPINSSFGISYMPQFPDNTSFIKAQPSIFSSGPDGVYDPRFTGYGDEDRTYLDDLQGNNKYYYDDIDAVRMPKYITRNKIDSCLTGFGDSYGKLSSGHMSLFEAKQQAESSWLQNSLDFRTSLSESLMRKKNEEMAQKRQAPKYTLF